MKKTGILAAIFLSAAAAVAPCLQTINVHAATFAVQTGYYIGDGTAGHAITGLGFKPDFVMIKDDTANGNDGADWASSAMPAGTTAKTSDADADVTGGTDITSLDSDGFTVGTGADVNAAGVRFNYVAFSGSDCSSSGLFCVGSYSGNGTSGHAVTVGFPPDLVWVKRSGASAGAWRSSSMATNVTQFFANTTQVTTNADFQALSATGFTVGTNAIVNTSGNTYWFVAFKKSSGAINVGSYTGTAAAQSITGMGFQPNFVMFKNANASTSQAGGFNILQSNGDYSDSFLDSADTTGNITSLDTDGFSVGTTAAANGSGNTIYWAGFGPSVIPSGSGTFTMADGSYTGNGSGQSISGLGFSPSLVVIGTSGQDNVFRTALMKGDDSATFSSSNFAGGITSLDGDGFTVGTATTTDEVGATYYWTAYGNAWDPETKSGAADFIIGAYTANEIDGRTIDAPFEPDMVLVKRDGNTAGVWRNSAEIGDNSSFFAATKDAVNNIQSFDSDGFTLGTANNVSVAGGVYNWFAFKAGPDFQVGTYTGNGTGQTIAGLGFQPDLAWVKRSTAVAGSFTMSSVPVGTSLRFGTGSNVTNDITNLTNDGFALGTGAEANATAGVYWYVAWQGKSYSASAYRLFNNQDSTDVGSALAAQDASATLSSTGEAFRLRVLVRLDDDTLFSGGENFKLQFASSTSCATVPSWNDVTASSLIAYNDNPSAADGDPLTANVNDPVHGTDAIDNQTYVESSPFTNTEGAIGGGEDGKWDFSLIDNGAAASTPYCLRVVKSDGTPLDAYANYASIVTANTPTPPALGNMSLNGGGAITLTPATTTLIAVVASSTAGSFPISFATSTIYRTALGTSCASDNKNCYHIASSGCVFSGSTTTVSCTAPLWYFAQSTGNASSGFPSDSWSSAITVTDTSGRSATATSSQVNVNVLVAIDVMTSSIYYGAIVPNLNTGATNQVTAVQNVGNSSSSLRISGTALLNGANAIPTSSAHYATSTFTFGGLEPQLSDILTTVSGFSLAAPTTTGAVTRNLYWGIGIPSGEPTGTYGGSVTFAAQFAQ